ncbi:hypothetical protein SAMN06297251_12931 [Fulvimarina manganoxydans]|uniref:HNH endonuclease n=1 Tax=Fulvimarina manganoxydans TaxID=937218 RepID=A0A1W2EP28_9HYPH|nr:hypothetical protein SAMN06297251_12931 [Fulvimarina manganoxydans]
MPKRLPPGPPPPIAETDKPRCWLCERPLGRRVEWHHPVPKSRGGRQTEPVHPICHRTLHAHFTNHELARMERDGVDIRRAEPIAAFLAFIAGKPPDFYAPTRKRRRDG